MKYYIGLFLSCWLSGWWSVQTVQARQMPEDGVKEEPAKEKTALRELQQQFVNLKFGMFIHFNMPTFTGADWADPDASPALFDPQKLDCGQWAEAAVSAGMKYGCLTTKHHSGFCIWDTRTTDYNVMHSPLKRDVVKEYTDAFRRHGLHTMLYYSILDTHHRLRPGFITRKHVEMVKAQLTELLSNYGEITAIILDGWDAPWSRISYDDIPFEDIYRLIKRLQPQCLVMDLNAAKYPKDALFYTDIKSYEQNAGQHISKETNCLPALSCLPVNDSWFWKEAFPVSPVKTPEVIVKENLEPFNRAYCNFILNVAPNRDGLLDANTIACLKQVGSLWKDETEIPPLPPFDAPVIAANLAKGRPAEASWSDDMWLMDFGNDDNFHTAWKSHPSVSSPWFSIGWERSRSFNMITIVDPEASIRKYRLLYEKEGTWEELLAGDNPGVVKIHRFDRVWGTKVKIVVDQAEGPVSIAELGVYDEQD